MLMNMNAVEFDSIPANSHGPVNVSNRIQHDLQAVVSHGTFYIAIDSKEEEKDMTF